MKRLQHASLVALILLLPLGCNRSGPSEVTLADSGIEIAGEALSWTAEDWPQWRGPRGDGILDDRPLPTTWSASQGITWSQDIPGRGHSSPVVVDGSIYLTTADEQQKKQIVLALDASTGEPKWETVVHEGNFPSPSRMHQKSTHANSTVACDGERVITTFFNDGKVIATALDLNGEQLWQTDVGPFVSRFGYAPSPLLYRSVVIVVADYSGGGFIAALDRASGDIAWRTQRPSDFSYSSPLLATIAGRDQLVLCGCEKVMGYDPMTGELLWSANGTTNSTCGTPVTDGVHVYASGGYPGQNTVCIKAEGKAAQVWSNRGRLYEPSLIYANGSLFGVSDNGIAYCWNPADGQEHWKKRLSGEFSASPIFVNGLLYVSNLDGATYVFRATEEGFDEVARNRIGDAIYASPAVSGSSLFIRAVHQVNGERVERLHRIDASSG